MIWWVSCFILAVLLLLVLILSYYWSWRKRKAEALIFSQREHWDEDKYLSSCDAFCDLSRKVATLVRAILAQKALVPIESIHADDRIDIELADLPLYFDGFPWLDVLNKLEVELGVGFTGKDYIALNKWHIDHIRVKRHISVKDLVLKLTNLVREKQE